MSRWPFSLGGLGGRRDTRYVVVAGVMRNFGSPDYWQLIEYTTASIPARYHAPTNVDSIDTLSNGASDPGGTVVGGAVRINYAAIGASRVSMFHAEADNDMVKDKLIVGTSVQTDRTLIYIARSTPLIYADFVSWNGSAFVMNRAGLSPFTVGAFDGATGTLSLTHPDLGGAAGSIPGAAWIPVSLTGRGPYQPRVSTASGSLDFTVLKIQWYNTTTGAPVLTPDTNCKAYITRGGQTDDGRQYIDPHTVGLSPQNIWFFGLLEKD